MDYKCLRHNLFIVAVCFALLFGPSLMRVLQVQAVNSRYSNSIKTLINQGISKVYKTVTH